MTDNIARELGAHSAQIEALRGDVHAIREDMAGVREDMADIKQTLAEHRGGIRVLLWISGAAATAGGVISAAVSHLFRGGGH